MEKLKASLACLFEVSVADISLQSTEGGLTHQSFICRVTGRKFFVKIYTLGGEYSYSVANINRLTNYMRLQGIPASQVVLYSPEFANIVVHDFVDGKMASGDISQIKAITQLYSRVALIGAEHGRAVSKPDYLSDINAFMEPIRHIENSAIPFDTLIHTNTLKLAEKVFGHLQKNLPEQGLFQIYMHDDFSEKNILMLDNQIKLLCDWDSYRLKLLHEHIACSACRFSTDGPMQGVMQLDKLSYFLRSIDPKVYGYISRVEDFVQNFPMLATLKHLRTYRFRNTLVHQGRPELKTSYLSWPLEHCLWLVTNRERVRDMVREVFA